MIAVSLTLQFLLELAVLAALAYWGSATGDSTSVQVALAIAAPLLALVAWGIFGSPKAPLHLKGVWRILLRVLLFGSAAAALAAAGHVVLGLAFAAVVAGNIAMLNALGQDA